MTDRAGTGLRGDWNRMMMDAEGSSTAAQSAQDYTETSPSNGFWRRVFSAAPRPQLREVTGDGAPLAPAPSTQRPALSTRARGLPQPRAGGAAHGHAMRATRQPQF